MTDLNALIVRADKRARAQIPELIRRYPMRYVNIRISFIFAEALLIELSNVGADKADAMKDDLTEMQERAEITL